MQLRPAILILLCMFCLSLPFPSLAQEADCTVDADYLAVAQALVETADYTEAIAAFSCVIESNPLALEAYRGRIEILLLTGAYSDAMLDYAAIKVQIIPTISDAIQQLLAFYETELESEPENIRLLAGYSFVQWANFNPEGAMPSLEKILELEPDNLYGLVMRGNNNFFLDDVEAGEADFSRALELEPNSADIYFIMADGYLYGLADLEHALEAVTTAAEMGLDTPRTDAIFATCYFYLGEVERALPYYASHIERTSPETIEGEPLERGQAVPISMSPGIMYRLPVEAEAGETLIITVSSEVLDTGAMGDFNEVDSIMILLGPDGSIVTGNDDDEGLNAGFEYVTEEQGSYTLLLASFEGAGLGEIVLSRN